ncbi:MAG: tetratricopeptide repeat protein [Thiomicrorhabdus sp.]|nr:tetratricopeptide repeat protein [Thiomicrorhabdus sp.]
MSVLLEALKKAAEDKKKALEGAVESTRSAEKKHEKKIQKKPSSKADSAENPQQNSDRNEVKVKLSLDSLKPSSEVKNVRKVKDEFTSSKESFQEISEATLSLKLDSASPKQESLKTTSDSKGTENIKKSAPSSLKLVIDGSTPTQLDQSHEVLVSETPPKNDTPKGMEEELSVLLSEPKLINVEPSFKQSLSESKQEPSKALTSKEEGALNSTRIEGASLEETMDENILFSHDTVKDKTLLKPEALDIEDSLTKTISSEPAKDDSVDRALFDLEKQQLKENEDSYKWSLDALPGYLGLGKKKQEKNNRRSEKNLNPILVAGALSEGRPKEKSFKLALILFVFLIIMGIFFYGVLYYQKQYENLEQKMNKYNLVKTQILVKEVNKVGENSNETIVAVNSGGIGATLYQKELNSVEAVSSLDHTSLVKRDAQNEASLPVTEVVESSVMKPVSKAPSKGQGTVAQSTKEPFKGYEVKSPKASSSNAQSSNDSSNNFKSLEKREKNKAIVVVHSEEDVLLDAYSNYEKGDLVQAQAVFESVLTMNPQNEFALIGLGNILLSKQQYVDAMAYYQQALVAQPSSLNAFEAIANISGHVELNSDWKNALLTMVRDYPKSSTLQYALGNLYATEKDWLAAQESYFQAVSLEPDNADYLVNLAVSLDQLGKYKPAARYYTEALAFVDVQSVNFNEAQVKTRLVTIRQFMAERKQ